MATEAAAASDGATANAGRMASDRPTATAGSAIRGAVAIRGAFAAAADEGRAAFIPYAVAGYPDSSRSEEIALALIDAGADLLEIGLPYSDPLADGLTLQRASGAALAGGATLERSIDLLRRVHAARPNIPLVPMGYVNQVIGGSDGSAVLRQLGDAGASGLILADLTPDEGEDVEATAARSGLSIVYLVTPTTPIDRRRMIAERSTGFLYAVSLAGVTGARTSLPAGIGRFLKEVRGLSPVPVAVGFGVSRPEHARRLAPIADGVIVASALVDALGPDGRDLTRMTALAEALRIATRR
jgi:tryptophan synthase alpha chain